MVKIRTMSKFSKIIKGNKPVLVDFFAEWCGACKMIAPILKEVKEDLGENVIILKIDIDKNPQTANTYQIRGVPTFMLFKEDKLLWQQLGMLYKNDLVTIISGYMK
jgi:thioredoxin 1